MGAASELMTRPHVTRTQFEADQGKDSSDELSNIPRPAIVLSSSNPSVACLSAILRT